MNEITLKLMEVNRNLQAKNEALIRLTRESRELNKNDKEDVRILDGELVKLRENLRIYKGIMNLEANKK